MSHVMDTVPEKVSFPEEGKKILEFWEKIDAFQNSLKQSKDRPRFTFYDGPPFATGLPHYGHILAGTIKDVVTRWAHQTGFHVERRFGWDTHGLPVEYEIDKTHNIRGPEDVAKMGIKKYNELCRGIVMRYSKEWETIVGMTGRWIDFRNDYKTLYPSYMESIWWVFSQLYQKGLVYRGVKVMPFSTACSTPLSNFEAGQNYKDTQDPSVVVTLPLVDDPSVSFVAWTTTPWTLPSNLALCVNPEMDYVKVQGKTKERNQIYILMEARLCQIFKNETEYDILQKYKGKDLEGLKYQPLFDYFGYMKEKGAFSVLLDGYVTSESGTGVVHQAPYFGEDDFRVCLGYGIITRDQEPVCPVDDAGRFTMPVIDFQGVHVKEADPDIIKNLRARGRLLVSERVNHSYPYCWRSDTPLIYRAVPSWFVRVEQMQDRLLASNGKTYWVPSFVKEKRFANWLRDARDWSVSRNRYWGTPIPLWVSDDLEEVVCIDSIAELEKLSGQKVTDLHRDNIDHLTIPSARPGKGPLKRISEVFDCWFESGCMPYAQVHYPFEKRKEFEDCFPADFIAEGIDQTRGWFYTLLVISTALFGKPPFKNLVVNGLVLAEDGQKMSKRKKNYPDPVYMIDKYGSDVLRLYLVNSPAVRGENLRFKETDVSNLQREVFLPWFNAYRFLVQNIEGYVKEYQKGFVYNEEEVGKSTNVMDQWILSFTQSLVKFVHQEMEKYHLYTVTPRLVKFVDNLTNWYVRMNRRRLKGDFGEENCQRALETLFSVLYTMIRVMAPFTPFITETMYQNLKKTISPTTLGKGETGSVHYQMIPAVLDRLINSKIESRVNVMQSVVELGRYIRDKTNNPIKYPLPEVVVIHKDQHVLDDVIALQQYVEEELNVRKVTTSCDKEAYGVKLKAEPDFKALGGRIKGDLKIVQEKIRSMTDDEIQSFLTAGSVEIHGHSIASNELRILYAFEGDKSKTSKYEAHSDSTVLILMDTTPSQEMQDEGLAREIVNRIQKARKKAKLVPTDEVTVWYTVDPGTELGRIANSYGEYIEGTTKAPFRSLKGPRPQGQVIIEEESKVKDTGSISLVITKGFCQGWMNSSSNSTGNGNSSPVCPWVNVILEGSPQNGSTSCHASFLLENPVGIPVLKNVDDLLKEAHNVFGFPINKAQVYDNSNVLNGNSSLASANGKTLVITTKPGHKPSSPVSCPTPFSRFVNVAGNGNTGTIFVENPADDGLVSSRLMSLLTQQLLKLTTPPSSFYSDANKNGLWTPNNRSQFGVTLYV
ncbi:isoleucyl-tRNA synthetase isoform X2 [Oratosquilla oratoria]